MVVPSTTDTILCPALKPVPETTIPLYKSVVSDTTIVTSVLDTNVFVMYCAGVNVSLPSIVPLPALKPIATDFNPWFNCPERTPIATESLSWSNSPAPKPKVTEFAVVLKSPWTINLLFDEKNCNVDVLERYPVELAKITEFSR